MTAEVGQTAADDQPRTERKKSKKARGYNNDTLGESSDVALSDTKRSGKKRKRDLDGGAEEQNGSTADRVEERGKRGIKDKNSKKEKHSVEQEVVEEEESKAEGKKARRKRDELEVNEVKNMPMNKESEDAEVKGDKVEGKKRKKQRKNRAAGEVLEDDEPPKETGEDALGGEEKKRKRRKMDSSEAKVVEEVNVEPPKKKRKNKTGFLDPEEDASLSGQSRKALSYAFFQFHCPSTWKFNKARQNWLIRNMWSSEAIPEVHFPLLVKYISQVQGGVRENLVKTCRLASETPKNEPEPVDAALETSGGILVPSAPKIESEGEKIKRSRAMILLAILTVTSSSELENDDSV